LCLDLLSTHPHFHQYCDFLFLEYFGCLPFLPSFGGSDTLKKERFKIIVIQYTLNSSAAEEEREQEEATVEAAPKKADCYGEMLPRYQEACLYAALQLSKMCNPERGRPDW